MNRLVSFIGTGRYEPASYYWHEFGEYDSCYAIEAIAALWPANEVHLLATTEARRIHEAPLCERLRSRGIGVKVIELPDGRDTAEQWQQFNLLQDALQGGSGIQVLLDITHGFRAQPFMAGAALAVRRALAPTNELPRVAYAEYRKDDASGRIWTLDLFTEILDWAHALGLFQRTGVAGPLVAHARRERDRQAKEVRARHGREFPAFHPLVDAIEAFARDLSTVRIASIVTGYAQEDAQKSSARSSAARLCEAIERCRDDVRERLPPLALVLDDMKDQHCVLSAPSMYGTDGQRALAALAQHYLDLERYPEAAIVAREARVNLHAPGAEAVEVNAPVFDRLAREAADRRFASSDREARTTADVRNDIGHGGFREQPLDAATLQRRVGDLVTGLMDLEASTGGRTVFVSRHPGARRWAEEEGLDVDEVVAHLDIECISPGDTVVGSLPVNLAAAVCTRGARYLHLALELPEGLRGTELSAVQLREYGARLIEYQVSAVDDPPRQGEMPVVIPQR